jgi:hypothetical protein
VRFRQRAADLRQEAVEVAVAVDAALEMFYLKRGSVGGSDNLARQKKGRL